MNAVTHIRLDAATACQLKCPSCPTAKGVISKNLGTGFLRFEDFKKFIQATPAISSIELANWGEIFLNPHLEKILEFACANNIVMKADSGANMNHISDSVLEALVKYKVRSLTCSIDGASQEAYAIYRVNGDFAKVIDNIKKINAFKKIYSSPFPALLWQYVAFGHNEHEITRAREMARELDMAFYLKLSWDDLYGTSFSPIHNRELIKKEAGLDVADRREYKEVHGQNCNAATCHQLWFSPQINYDGKLLGCCINHWGNFGNVFEEGLEQCLNGTKMKDTRNMLLGKTAEVGDSPCINCDVYQDMKKSNSWLNPKDMFDR